MHQVVLAGTVLGALGAGLIAGTFFAFSTFVMRGLANIPPAAGIVAMQSINLTVSNLLFMGVLLGTALLSLVLGAASLARWTEPGSSFRLLGSLAYLAAMVITIAGNVPRNNALMAIDATAATGAAFWTTFVSEWTILNTARLIAAFVATLLLTIAVAQSWTTAG